VAKALLAALLERELLELADENQRDTLVAAIRTIIEADAKPRRVAKKLANMFIEHDAVEDLYATDDEIVEVILSL
jgi:hypothetical protein